MVQRVATVAFEGIEARAVDVQVQVAPGLPAFNHVGCQCQSCCRTDHMTEGPRPRRAAQSALDPAQRNRMWWVTGNRATKG